MLRVDGCPESLLLAAEAVSGQRGLRNHHQLDTLRLQVLNVAQDAAGVRADLADAHIHLNRGDLHDVEILSATRQQANTKMHLLGGTAQGPMVFGAAAEQTSASRIHV